MLYINYYKYYILYIHISLVCNSVVILTGKKGSGRNRVAPIGNYVGKLISIDNSL